MILLRPLYYLVSLLSIVSATPSNCSAVITLNSSMPGHAAFMYHDIVVQNTGTCGITRVFASITLPPYEEPFAYYNITNSTGELTGLPVPFPSGSIKTGGTIVLSSARIPYVELLSVECEASCTGVAQSQRSVRINSSPATVKVETLWGSNPRWLALHLLDDVDTNDIWLTDAKGSRQLMKRENWDTKTAYTFTPDVAPLELPISLELRSFDGQSIVLKNFITDFSYAVQDSNIAYENSPVTEATDYVMSLVSHPASNRNWVGLSPYGTLASRVTSISIKAANTGYAPMTSSSPGFFTISSPNLSLQLPFSARVTLDDDSVLEFDNVVKSSN